jgi:hypothetical protein
MRVDPTIEIECALLTEIVPKALPIQRRLPADMQPRDFTLERDQTRVAV